jgi:serine/threonine protein kinase
MRPENREAVTEPQAKDARASAPELVRVLKTDALGCVELVRVGDGLAVRRRALGGRVPGSRALARLLLAREARALGALAGTPGIAALRALARDHGELLRDFVPGVPLCRSKSLPRDFFERLEELVRAVHERGVCHNDLHKEQNVIVRPDGRPALIDFQLASVHRHRGATFRSRTREDLRHVAKHQRRYTRPGRAPAEVAARRPAVSARRSSLAWAWRRGFKPLYELFTRRILGWRDGEPRRPSSGPWPQWSAPIGRGESDYNTSSR